MTAARFYSAIAQDTTLTASASNAATSLSVSAVVGYPSSYPFTIAVDYGNSSEELMDVTNVSGTTFTVTRAVNGTTAVSHAVGATVRHVITARDMTDLQNHISYTTGIHGVTGNVVGDTDTQTLTNKTLATPVIDTVSASAVSASPSLWPSVTTGTINIGAGLTTGTINIATSGTGATPINIGHTNALIGTKGTHTHTGTATIKPTADSTTVFQVLPSGSSTPVLNVDTTNTRVGIGTNAPTAKLNLSESTAGSVAIVLDAAGYIGTTAEFGHEYGGTYIKEQNSAGYVRILVGSTERVKVDGSSGANALVTITGSLSRKAPVTKSADFTVGIAENWLINNKSGSTCTVTLPSASTYSGREITINNYQAQTVVSASANVVPQAGGSAGTAILAATAGKWATLVSDGTNWIIMASN